MTLFDGHICLPPAPRRAHWWTCEQCGQIWRIENKRWRLSAPEGAAPPTSTQQRTMTNSREEPGT